MAAEPPPRDTADSGGDRDHAVPRSADEWMPHVYAELRALAAHFLAGERPGHTLQATALVHEAYARLAKRSTGWADRGHFFRAAVTALQRILVEHARSRQRRRRLQLPSDAVELGELAGADPDAGVLAVDAALQHLLEVDEQKAQIVQLRFFGGFRAEEVAEILGLSPRTVARDWDLARAWLSREIQKGLDLDS